MGTIIYLIGLILAILAVIDIFKKPIPWSVRSSAPSSCWPPAGSA